VMKSKPSKGRGKPVERKTGKPRENPVKFSARQMTPMQMERLIQQQIRLWGINL